jgi:hypothetical protein
LTDYAFSVRGIDGRYSFITVYGGFDARLRIGGNLSRPAVACSRSLANVKLSISTLAYAQNAGLIIFNLTNSNPTTVLVDLEVDGDLDLRGVDDPPIAALPGGRGLITWSDRYALTFLLRSSPLVTDVTTFWFGRADDLEDNYWVQQKAELFYGDDSGLVWSYQRVSVPPGEVVTKAAIIKFGEAELNKLSLTLNLDAVPETVALTDVLNIPGVVTSDVPNAVIQLLTFVDGSYGAIYRWRTAVAPGKEFSFPFSAKSFQVGTGSYTFSVYAVDQVGTLSAAAKISLSVLAPTATVKRSPAATALPRKTRTPPRPPTRSSSRPPAQTLPPRAPALPIRIFSAAPYGNFEVTGAYGDLFEVHLSTESGFTTGLQLAHENLSTTAVGLKPFHFKGITLETDFVNLSKNSVLVVYRLVNEDKAEIVVSLESDLDVLLNWDDGAPIASLPDKKGVVVYSGDFAFTVLGKGAPLVTDITAYWFGTYAEAEHNYFSQTPDDDYFSDDTLFAISWHNISIPPGGSVTKTFAIKWALPETNKLGIKLDPAPAGAVGLASIPLSGTVSSSKTGEKVSIFVVADGNFSNIHRIAENIAVNAVVQFTLDLATFGLKPGEHQYVISAVDTEGTISNGETIVVKAAAREFDIIEPEHLDRLPIVELGRERKQRLNH